MQADLIRTYDELSNIPEFQEVLIQSCSPRIIQEWQECAQAKLISIRKEISFFEKNEYADSKQNISRLRKRQEKLAKRLYSNDNRVTVMPSNGTDSFNPEERIINLNPATIKKGIYFGERPDKDGTEKGEGLVLSGEGRTHYRMSLQHTVCHEQIHSIRANSYRFFRAFNEVREEIYKTDRVHELVPTDLDLNKELFAEKIEERYTIALTNRIMQHYYGEERREGHAGTIAKENISNHLSALEMPAIKFPLPVLTNDRNLTNAPQARPAQISKPDYTLEEMKEIIRTCVTRDSPQIVPVPKGWDKLSGVQVKEFLEARSAVLSFHMDEKLAEIDKSQTAAKNPAKPQKHR